jgi:hypothetical protein
LTKDKDVINNPRTKLHICKPQHTSQCFSLQKSSFLADAPAKIDTFAFIDNDFKNIDDILHKDAGCGSELDYVEQTSHPK